MSSRTLGAVAVVAAAAVGLAACGSTSDAGADGSQKLTVAVTAPTWTPESAPLLLGKTLGFYKAEGLDVTFNLAKSGTESVQQLIGGNAQIAVATGEPVVIAAGKGSALQYFLPFYGRFIYQIAAVDGSGITSIKDLQGKRVGITNANSTGATFLRTALAAEGVPKDSVTVVPIGVGAQQLTAIKNKQVDALALWDTLYTSAKNNGVNTTVLPVTGMDGLFGGGIVAKADALKADPDLYAKFGRATAKALMYAANNEEKAVRQMWAADPSLKPSAGEDEATALKDDIAILDTRLEVLMPDRKTTDWVNMSTEATQKYIDWAAGAGLITKKPAPADILDTALSKQIGDFTLAQAVPPSGS